MRLSIRNKFVMTLGLLAVCVLTVGISSVAVVRFNETELNRLQQERLRSLLLARDAVASLHRYLKDVEVAVSTKDPELLDDDDAAIADIRLWVADVRQLEGAPDPSFDGRLTDLVASCKAYVQQMTSEGTELEGVKTGKHASDVRAILIDDLQLLEQHAKDNFEAEVSRIGAFNQQATKLSLLLVTILTVATVGLSGVILATVLRRIRNLGEHFAGTDLEKITPLLSSAGGRDELADLVDAANRMLLGIRESRSQLVGKALLDSVIEALVDVLVVVDGDGIVVRANQACERLLGAIPGGHEGSRFSTWLVSRDGVDDVDPAKLLQSVAAGATISAELSLRTAGGSLVPVHLLGAPLAEGDVASAVFVARDLRAKLAGEAHMQQVQAQLVQASKLASLGTLGAGVAHELNNPLAAIRGYADLLTTAAYVTGQGQGLAAKIVKASDRMRKIIDHLRTFSADTSRRDKRAIDVNVIVQDSLILLQNQIAGSGIVVDVDLAPNLALVFADANQLESVVQNLIINSRDAFADVSDLRPRRIHVSSAVSADRREVSVTVRDNANGIPAHVQARVFDPFFTTKDVGKGTGLGLSIAHGIAKDHGGDLSFTTESGVGTAFTVKLPAAALQVAPVPEQATAPAEVPRGSGAGLKPIVVIIDDEPDIGDVLTQFLGTAFATEYFEDAKLALVRLAERPFDLVITDMKMPSMSGLDVIRTLRSRDPGAKILLVTGHAQNEDEVVNALKAGAAGVIPKPFPAVDEMCKLVDATLTAKPTGKLPRVS